MIFHCQPQHLDNREQISEQGLQIKSNKMQIVHRVVNRTINLKRQSSKRGKESASRNTCNGNERHFVISRREREHECEFMVGGIE
jgi:hypothetical protein